MKATIRSRPWQGENSIKKILVIRFQALGDTIITLPYLQNLKNQYPDIELDLLTRMEVSAIPKNTNIFSNVIELGGGRNAKLQFIHALSKLPRLWWRQYDAVMDLQNNKISKVIRASLKTKAWVEFDRSSLLPAGERTRLTIEALWKWKVKIETEIIIKARTEVVLDRNGLKPNHELVLLNPAGYCTSRNWPLDFYVKFAKQWLRDVNPMTQFLLLLLNTHGDKATYIEVALGKNCLNLTGKINQVEAFSIIKNCKLMLSEDSGLMHMAWVQGIPTIALFSSSRKIWSAPQGDWSYTFDSADMECGPCLLEICKYEDNRCLTRFTPEIVLSKARELYERK